MRRKRRRRLSKRFRLRPIAETRVSASRYAPWAATFFTADELVLTLPAPQLPPTQTNTLAAPAEPDAPTPPAPLVVRQRFAGATRTPTLSGVERLPGEVNYLLGDDPDQWHTQVPLLRWPGLSRALSWHRVWPTPAPMVSSNAPIRWPLAPTPARSAGAYTGVTELRLDDTGALQAGCHVAKTCANRQRRAHALHAGRAGADGLAGHPGPTWCPSTVRYLIGQQQQVGFALGSYDRSQPLTIDPTLTYGSYLGGAGSEEGRGIAARSAGPDLCHWR